MPSVNSLQITLSQLYILTTSFNKFEHSEAATPENLDFINTIAALLLHYYCTIGALHRSCWSTTLKLLYNYYYYYSMRNYTVIHWHTFDKLDIIKI